MKILFHDKRHPEDMGAATSVTLGGSGQCRALCAKSGVERSFVSVQACSGKRFGQCEN